MTNADECPYVSRGGLKLAHALAAFGLVLTTNRTTVLWSLADIATLIGLLGTINGLIGGFAAIGKAAADQRSQILATKIAEAMNNTWLGLAIAATCMIGHLFLSAASKKQQQELESFALKLENLLAEVIANPPTIWVSNMIAANPTSRIRRTVKPPHPLPPP